MLETSTKPSDARAVEWLAAKNRGATFAEIARKVGMTRQRVHQVVLTHPDYQPGPQRPPRSPAFIEAVRKLRAEGLSAAEVGQRLGVSRNTVIGVCHRHLKGKEEGYASVVDATHERAET